MSLKKIQILAIGVLLTLAPMDAISEELAGTWEIKVYANTRPVWVIDVADDLTATLVSSSSVSNPNYESITLEWRDGKLVVSLEQIQSCGNRIIEFILKEKKTSFKGYSTGEKSNCKGGTYRSKRNSVRMERK